MVDSPVSIDCTADTVCRTRTCATDSTVSVWVASAFTVPTEGTDDADDTTAMSWAASTSIRGRDTTG
jgi:hypothetical protein